MRLPTTLIFKGNIIFSSKRQSYGKVIKTTDDYIIIEDIKGKVKVKCFDDNMLCTKVFQVIKPKVKDYSFEKDTDSYAIFHWSI